MPTTRGFFAERLSAEALPDLQLRLDLLADFARSEKLDSLEREQQRHLTLEVGIP
jgi:hypothetical protein